MEEGVLPQGICSHIAVRRSEGISRQELNLESYVWGYWIVAYWFPVPNTDCGLILTKKGRPRFFYSYIDDKWILNT